jgi:small subunit ribosomal protein S20
MANLDSAKKKARKDIVRYEINLARRTAVKTAIKKVLVALEQGSDIETTKTLMREAESKLARAKGKGVMHRNTAARKISRLAQRVAAAQKGITKAA